MKKLFGLFGFLILILTSCCVYDYEVPGTKKVLSIAGVAKVIIPKSSTAYNHVKFNQQQNPESEDVFNALAEVYQVGKALPFQLYLNVGPNQPKNDEIEVTFELPIEFINQKPDGYGFEIFAQSIQGGEMEFLDSYDIIPSTLDIKKRIIRAKLPASLFTSGRNYNRSFEIVLKVATTPVKN